MLLTDDNFSSIEAAIEEGRGVFDNLTKFIVWTLPTNMGEGLIILAAILLGTALPVLPLHILWINMSTAILLGLMLVFEPKETDLMLRPPRDPKIPILTIPIILRIALVSFIMLGGAFGLFLLERRVYGSELPGVFQHRFERVDELRVAVFELVQLPGVFDQLDHAGWIALFRQVLSLIHI